jgi:hypothetical protein
MSPGYAADPFKDEERVFGCELGMLPDLVNRYTSA